MPLHVSFHMQGLVRAERRAFELVFLNFSILDILELTGAKSYTNGLRGVFMNTFKDAIFDKKVLQDIIQNRKYNISVIDYYERLSYEYEYEFKKSILHNRSLSIEDCNKFWLLDKYEVQKIKDIK